MNAPLDLTELRRLHEVATEPPWAWEMTGDKDNSWGVGVIVDDDENLITGRNETGENLLVESVCEAGADGNPADAALIVAMRNALPGLLAEVERLRAAAPQVDADAFERFARTADPAALAELIEKATGAKVESVSTSRAAAPASEDDELQRRAGAWHRSRFPEAEQHHVALKAIEELGEVAEAVNAIAGVNSATANGALSVPAEAADVVIALMVLLDRWHTADLLVEVATKLLVLEDPGSGHRSAARRAAGSPPPTPAREQVLAAIEDNVTGDSDDQRQRATDAVMGLIAQPDREPLWRGKTRRLSNTDESEIYLQLPVPPGTAVRVDEDTT